MEKAVEAADRFMADQEAGRTKSKAKQVALDLVNEILSTTETGLKAVQQNGGIGFRRLTRAVARIDTSSTRQPSRYNEVLCRAFSHVHYA